MVVIDERSESRVNISECDRREHCMLYCYWPSAVEQRDRREHNVTLSIRTMLVRPQGGRAVISTILAERSHSPPQVKVS